MCGTDRRFRGKQFHNEKGSDDTKGAKNDHFIILYLNVYRIWKAGAGGDPGGVGDFEGDILSGVCAAVFNCTFDFWAGLYCTAAFADRGGGQLCCGESLMVCCDGHHVYTLAHEIEMIYTDKDL